MWTDEVEQWFFQLKKLLRVEPVLVLSLLPDFDKLFEVECDASLVRVGAVLSHAGHPVAYFSEKLVVQ